MRHEWVSVQGKCLIRHKEAFLHRHIILSLSCAHVSHLICYILQSNLWPVISVHSTSFWSHSRQVRYLWPYRRIQEGVRKGKAAWLTAFTPRT